MLASSSQPSDHPLSVVAPVPSPRPSPLLTQAVLDPATPVLRALDRFGPGAASALTPTLSESLAYVRGLALSHYENFSVLSRLVPHDLRDDFAAVYAFCRWSDDLGDETGSTPEARERSLELLRWWSEQTSECFDGRATHPVLIALRQTIQKHALPQQPFQDLIDAFVQDQTVTTYETWPQLLEYCRRSANPVGRIVLHLGGYPDTPANARRYALSDATCTALQLINFWQDVRRDLFDRDRIYIPGSESGITPAILRDWAARGNDPAARVPYIHAMNSLVQRTRELFQSGSELPALLNHRIRPVVWLFGQGGMAVLRRVEQIGCATLWERPRLSGFTKATLVLRAAIAARTGRNSASASTSALGGAA